MIEIRAVSTALSPASFLFEIRVGACIDKLMKMCGLARFLQHYFHMDTSRKLSGRNLKTTIAFSMLV